MVAILAIAPALAVAQTVTSPAQPASTPTLQSRVAQPAALAAAKDALDRGSVVPSAVRISTGVVQPKILHAAELNRSRLVAKTPGRDEMVVVQMTVDANGKPSNLKVVKGADPFTDQGVLEAVSQYRFEPATLDGQAISIPVTLEYTIQ
jgi:TonB family protein